IRERMDRGVPRRTASFPRAAQGRRAAPDRSRGPGAARVHAVVGERTTGGSLQELRCGRSGASRSNRGRRASRGREMAGTASAIGIAAEGLAVVLSIFGLAVVLIVFGFHKIGGLVLVCSLVVALFFRDPERFPAQTAGVVISGADGKVTDISEVEMPGSAG